MLRCKNERSPVGTRFPFSQAQPRQPHRRRVERAPLDYAVWLLPRMAATNLELSDNFSFLPLA